MSRQAHFDASTDAPTIEQEKGHDLRLESVVSGTDAEKSSSRYANSEAGLDHKEGMSSAERRLVRKMDFVILPLTALLYVSAPLSLSRCFWLIQIIVIVRAWFSIADCVFGI